MAEWVFDDSCKNLRHRVSFTVYKSLSSNLPPLSWFMVRSTVCVSQFPLIRHPVNSDLWRGCWGIILTHYFSVIFPYQQRGNEHLQWLPLQFTNTHAHTQSCEYTCRQYITLHSYETLRRSERLSVEPKRKNTLLDILLMSVTSLTMWSEAHVLWPNHKQM